MEVFHSLLQSDKNNLFSESHSSGLDFLSQWGTIIVGEFIFFKIKCFELNILVKPSNHFI